MGAENDALRTVKLLPVDGVSAEKAATPGAVARPETTSSASPMRASLQRRAALAALPRFGQGRRHPGGALLVDRGAPRPARGQSRQRPLDHVARLRDPHGHVLL